MKGTLLAHEMEDSQVANERVCHNLLLSEDLGTWDAVFDVVSTLALETKALVSNRDRKSW